MVGEGEQAPEKTIEEIAHEGEEGIARVARLTKMGKRHKGLQDNSGSSCDEPRDGAPSRRHHPKFNPRRATDRDRLRHRS
jgi:hypothetical protein